MNVRTNDQQILPAAARAAVALVGVLAAALVAEPASAAPGHIVMRQLTHITTGTIETPKLQLQDGNVMAFASNADVLGPGTQTANRQIYIWKENPDGTSSFTKATNGVGCDSWYPARPTDTVFSDRPMVVAFVSTCNFDPGVGNADGNPEIFLYEVESGLIHQITKTTAPVVNDEPFMSDSGRCLVFSSNGDLDNNTPMNPFYESDHPGPGYHNPDGSREVFVYGKLDSQNGYPYNAPFVQISNGPSGTTSGHPVIGGYIFGRQCQTSAFQSDHDQLGTGLMGQQIYTYNMPSSAIELVEAKEIEPHGTVPGTYQNSSISEASPFARGPHIVFETDADLWQNGSTGNDVFDFRAYHPRMTQYTNVGSPLEAKRPQVADGGGVVTLDSNGEILAQDRAAADGSMPPFNADGNHEIFRLKGRKYATQITRTEECENTDSTIMDDGNRVGFVSNCDIVPGGNAAGKTQVFLYSLERVEAGIMQPGACTQAGGCCLGSRKEATCYSDLSGRKPKISRPNCLDRETCIQP
jgi:hypothetical protein